jgi:hypothetical protein
MEIHTACYTDLISAVSLEVLQYSSGRSMGRIQCAVARQTDVHLRTKSHSQAKELYQAGEKKIKKSFYIALFLFSSNYDVMNVSRVKKKIMIGKPTKHQNEKAIVSFCDYSF